MFSGGKIKIKVDPKIVGQVPKVPEKTEEPVNKAIRSPYSRALPKLPTFAGSGFARKPFDLSPEKFADYIMNTLSNEQAAAVFADSFKKFAAKEIAGRATEGERATWAKIFEILVKNGSYVVSDKHFRARLTRDENLLANQIIREVNTNIAYETVAHLDPTKTPDEEFWAEYDKSPYAPELLRRAAVDFLKNHEKLEETEIV